jgi:hypothetical protein
MILTNCNTLDEVVCGCTPTFSSYVNNSISVLDVGNLLGGSCTFTAYVIEWYRNGELALVSGTVGSDPDVTAFHPFTGSAAIPVLSGTWVPSIRWVVVGGVKIHSKPTSCKKWCRDLYGLPPITLPSINILSINCGISNITGDYQYRLTYNTSQDYAYAARTVIFELPSDGSIINFAIQFTGYTVADKVEVFYKDTTQMLMGWVIGTNNTALAQYTTMPYERNTNLPFKFAFALPAYQAGDYITIRVTPSVRESNILTNWQIDMKCLTAAKVFDCDFLTDNMRSFNIPATRLDWDAASCRWRLVVKYLEEIPSFQTVSNVNYSFSQYAGMQVLLYSTAAWFNRGALEGGVLLNYNKTATLYWWTQTGYATAYPTVGNVNFKKVGNVVTITCADIADYNWYKASYDTAMASTFRTTWTADNTSILHYRHFFVYWRAMPLGCGDTTYPIRNLYIFIDSDFDFNPTTKTITITLATTTNGIVQETCNDSWTQANNNIAYLNLTISGADFDENTICSYPIFRFGQGYTGVAVNKQTNLNGVAAITLQSNHTTPCDPSLYKWEYGSNPQYYLWFIHWLKCEITATVDGNGDFTESPSDNFRVYDYLHPTTRMYNGGAMTLIYEKADGVQIYP